jgi:ATP-dependent RNA helicase DDX46/PRP5
MEGPIAVIMTPTRELATQIYAECLKFTRILNLRVICAYGGSPIKDNIADLKRGAEIIVCTPGRMIDLLTCNSGRLTNLKRCTYVVLDEADRMFDMGFEPQVMAIVDNIRPDKQTVMFSATFPRQMEALARRILKNPCEIVVGGRSVVNTDVRQFVEIHDEDGKFLRLLEVLGEWHEKKTQRILIFVDRQDAADTLLKDLMKRGYACMSLHGGKDQLDRDSTLADFKSGVINILIATSVAARGLDVRNLNLVVNYECPNHMEDYVHRVGRTGRAGNSGTAYTFITPSQEKFAPDIVKALEASGADVPEELRKMSEEYLEKVKIGSVTLKGSGFGGKGLERIDQEREILRNIQKSTYGEGLDAEEEEEDEYMEVDGELVAKKKKEKKEKKENDQAEEEPAEDLTAESLDEAVKKAEEAIRSINDRICDHVLATTGKDTKILIPGALALTKKTYSAEVDINDIHQQARWKVTSRDAIIALHESCRAAVTVRGTFIPRPTTNYGEKKLHLYIETDSEYDLERAKNEIKRMITEALVEAAARGVDVKPVGSGKYSVV